LEGRRHIIFQPRNGIMWQATHTTKPLGDLTITRVDVNWTKLIVPLVHSRRLLLTIFFIGLGCCRCSVWGSGGGGDVKCRKLWPSNRTHFKPPRNRIEERSQRSGPSEENLKMWVDLGTGVFDRGKRLLSPAPSPPPLVRSFKTNPKFAVIISDVAREVVRSKVSARSSDVSLWARFTIEWSHRHHTRWCSE
jgi:hypothetical protein